MGLRDGFLCAIVVLVAVRCQSGGLSNLEWRGERCHIKKFCKEPRLKTQTKRSFTAADDYFSYWLFFPHDLYILSEMRRPSNLVSKLQFAHVPFRLKTLVPS